MNDDLEWFAPKRYGFGAGLPISWQGWAVLAAFLIIVGCATILWRDKPALAAAIVIPATAALILITWRTTRGGWRWRWGGRD